MARSYANHIDQEPGRSTEAQDHDENKARANLAHARKVWHSQKPAPIIPRRTSSLDGRRTRKDESK